MKKRVFLLLAVMLLTIGSGFSGRIALLSVQSVVVAKPAHTTYTHTVQCTGEIVEKDRRDTYFSLPLVVSEVKTAVGKQVKKGDVLAVVDKTATAAALISSYSTGMSEDVYRMLEKNVNTDVMSVFANSFSLSDNLKKIPTYVYAEIDGTVTAFNLIPGTPAKAYTSSVTIIDDSSLVAKVSVGEENIEKIKIGDAAVISSAAFGKRTYPAVVSEIYPSAYKKYDNLSYETVVDVVLTPTETTDKMRAGYSAKAGILLADARPATTIAYEAVRQDDVGEYVYVLHQGRAEKSYIVTGLELSNGFEIVSGVEDTAWIIQNPDSVKDGQLVRVSRYEN